MKVWYGLTNKKNFVKQIAKMQARRTTLRYMKQKQFVAGAQGSRTRSEPMKFVQISSLAPAGDAEEHLRDSAPEMPYVIASSSREWFIINDYVADEQGEEVRGLGELAYRD